MHLVKYFLDYSVLLAALSSESTSTSNRSANVSELTAFGTTVTSLQVKLNLKLEDLILQQNDSNTNDDSNVAGAMEIEGTPVEIADCNLPDGMDGGYYIGELYLKLLNLINSDENDVAVMANEPVKRSNSTDAVKNIASGTNLHGGKGASSPNPAEKKDHVKSKSLQPDNINSTKPSTNSPVIEAVPEPEQKAIESAIKVPQSKLIELLQQTINAVAEEAENLDNISKTISGNDSLKRIKSIEGMKARLENLITEPMNEEKKRESIQNNGDLPDLHDTLAEN